MKAVFEKYNLLSHPTAILGLEHIRVSVKLTAITIRGDPACGCSGSY